MANYYKPGCWNVICDACGRKRKSDEVRERWDGFYVCSATCWEPRHPLDFMKLRPEHVGVPYTSPEPDYVYVTVDYIEVDD